MYIVKIVSEFHPKLSIAFIGTGPAALMCASQLQKHSKIPLKITFIDKRKMISRKLLIAGSSGLNITNSLPLSEFPHKYSGPLSFWKKSLHSFGPKEWIEFIEKELHQETFIGTSGRAFVKEMKASKLLKAWKDFLNQNVRHQTVWKLGTEVIDFQPPFKGDSTPIDLHYTHFAKETFDLVVFALGGGSYETASDEPLLLPPWPEMFSKKNITTHPFKPENVGYEVSWSPAFLKEAEGKPLKQCLFKSNKGEMMGDLMITRYGLEGTPVYTYGVEGEVHIDLKPDLRLDELLKKCLKSKENLSPERRIKKSLALSEASLALIFHYTPSEIKKDLSLLIERIKNFPLHLLKARPLSESISSSGGLDFSECDDHLKLKKFENIYAMGEMIDWNAPTGGYLIQGCVTMGAWVAHSILQSSLYHSKIKEHQ